MSRPADNERALIEAALSDVWPVGGAAPRPPAKPAEPAVTWPEFEGYEVLREIHRGAQGVVYEAFQKGTRRKVAVKVMLEGPFAGARDTARFEREVYILGQLKHPNIVAIHDSGHVAGHFYYVMDYVGGAALDAHFNASTPLRQALELFLKVCEAVSAAHRIGVIHRDLKPGNVRVTAHGEPHVLDFGLAKVGTAEFTGDGMQRMSVSGQFIGSLPWASPEQAEGRPELIDVRSDVYSLGVMLYQMLTGRFPYEVTGRLPDVVEHITRSEPAPPRALRREIDDELETIVLKCLAKDRERRYQSAGELARDVRRYLAGEPIEAKRDSALYLLRKALVRHRVAFAVGGAFAVLVVGATIALSLMYGHSVAARHATEEFARRVGALTLSFDPKAVADPFSPEVPDPGELRKVEQLAAAVADAKVAPALGADLHSTIGLAYLKLRVYGQAEVHLRRALEARRVPGGGDDAALATSLHDLGRALFFESKFNEAEACDAQALEIRRRLYGAAHAEVASSLNDLAACFMREGRLQDAEKGFHDALEMRRALLAPGDPWVAASINNLARCLMERGQLGAALPLFEEALERIRALKVDPVFVVRSLRNIASCRIGLGREQEAVAALDEAEALIGGLSGDRGPDAAQCERLRVRLDYEGGKLASAEDRCVTLIIAQAGAGPGRDPGRADTQALLALVRIEMGELSAAREPLDEALAARRAVLGEGHPEVAALQALHARLRLGLGEIDEALRECEVAMAVLRDPQKLAEAHPAVADALCTMATIREAQGDAADALPLLQEMLRLRQAALPEGHWRVGDARSRLGDCLAALGRGEEAVALLTEGADVLSEALGDDDPRTQAATQRIARLIDSIRR